MDIAFNFDYRGDEMRAFPFERLAEFVLRDEGFPETTALSVSFVTDDEIAELNEEYRGKVGPTDVISFEADGFDDDDEFDWPDDPEDAVENEIGDIIIAPDVAERQCPEFGMTFEGELSLLLVHGLLHLCGYDHIEDEDAVEMQARERELLESWSKDHPAVAPPNYELNTDTVVGPH